MNGSKLPKGHAVQFFLEVDPGQKKVALAKAKGWGSGVQLLQSHGWLEGTLKEAYDPNHFDAAKPATWPLVQPSPDIVFEVKGGGKAPSEARRVRHIRDPITHAPLLSLLFVRWGGAYSAWMDEQEANDGDWGKYGSPPSDEYMAALVELGVLAHPRIKSEDGGNSVEIFNLIVKSSVDLWNLPGKVEKLRSILRGKKRTSFWMLWPAEWEDTGDPDFACYVERQAMHNAMRACEAQGVPAGFPHPADQLELITSKSWMATLSVHPGARLPACTLVSKDRIVNDLPGAAKEALAALGQIRKLNPFPVKPGEPPAPSEINKDGVQKGVVKLGWSWENRFVSVFVGEEQLRKRMKDMMSQPGLLASYCIVQEWVDFDFEMRLYFLPPPTWEQGTLQPTRIECNAWGARSQEDTVGQSHASFSKLTEDACLQRWSGDAEAWASAKAQAIETSQLLITWLLASNARPVPMIRLDFMLKRLGPGQARVAFGEFCEMGACCLGWKDGPPTIWKAAIDSALR